MKAPLCVLFLLSFYWETICSFEYHLDPDATFSWGFEPDSNIIFHAYVIEQNNEIITYPPLNVKLGRGLKVCQVHLLPTSSHAVPSFISAHVSDAIHGQLELQLNETDLYQIRLNKDKSLEGGVYHLKVLAEDCSSPPKLTIPWTINIVIVPTEQPVWSQHHYSFSIPSNLPVGEVVGKVTAYAAFDFAPSPEYLATRLGDETGMCSYVIEQPADKQFDINGHGVIRSRGRFYPIEQEDDIRLDLNVTGFDCHLPIARSSTVLVSVFIRPECAPHWSGLNQELVYPTLSAPQLVSPTATLKTCEVPTADECTIEQAYARMKILWTREDQTHLPGASSAADFCDLDPLSLRAQRHLCGISLEKAIELLPVNESPSILLQPGRDPKTPTFDGSLGWRVPDNIVPQHKHRLDDVVFTLSFWMNHSVVTKQRSLNAREHILCITDDREKNRHHFAIFIRNCKLVVVLRREPINTIKHESYQLYPSRWNFAVDEVCDSEWHHYSLVYHPPPEQIVQGQSGNNTPTWNVNDEMKLYVDGDLIPSDPELIHITDAMPMQKIHSQVLSTRIDVGACWHSGEGKYVQQFVGQLSGLTLSRGIAESQSRLQCLVNCKPRLHVIGQLVGRNSEHPGLPALHRSEVDNLAFEASNLDDLNGLVRTTIFFNPRIKHEPMLRPEPVAILLNTDLRSRNACSTRRVPDKTISIVRLPINERATAVLAGNYAENHLLISPSQSTYNDIFSALPAETLLLTKIGSQPIEVSLEALYQGVWIFPSLDVSWKRTGALVTPGDLEHRGIASYCDINLCRSKRGRTQSSSLDLGESLAINEEFIGTQLNVGSTEDGMRIDGPAPVEDFNRAIQHIRWIYTKPVDQSMRCFQARCAAEFENIKDLATGESLRIQSNTIYSEFRIRLPVREQRVQPNQTTSDEYRRDARSLPEVDVSQEWSMWDNKGTYILAASVSALLLLMFFVFTIAFLRIRRPVESGAATNRRSSWCSKKGPARPYDSSRMQLIANPTSNQEELIEYERRFCLYDSQAYGGNPEDISDGPELDFQGHSTKLA